jgi:hypothetical protein
MENGTARDSTPPHLGPACHPDDQSCDVGRDSTDSSISMRERRDREVGREMEHYGLGIPRSTLQPMLRNPKRMGVVPCRTQVENSCVQRPSRQEEQHVTTKVVRGLWPRFFRDRPAFADES